MNILFDELPSAIQVGGKYYRINSDFRTCLRIIAAFEDPDLAAVEKQAVLIEALYQQMPDNYAEAIAAGVRFLNGGEEQKEGSGPRLYSMTKDAKFIFAAFRQTHGIDLSKADLHWFEFMALFSDLGSNTTFCNLVGLRKRIKTGKASKEDKEAAHDMGDAFDLSDIDTTPQQKIVRSEFQKANEERLKNKGRK